MLLNQKLVAAARGVMVGLGSMVKLIPLPADYKAAIASGSTAIEERRRPYAWFVQKRLSARVL
jgi:hypothetical protein